MEGGLLGDPYQGIMVLALLVVGVWLAIDLATGNTTTLPGKWTQSRDYSRDHDPAPYWAIVIFKGVIVLGILGRLFEVV